jgi:hypothetical protein
MIASYGHLGLFLEELKFINGWRKVMMDCNGSLSHHAAASFRFFAGWNIAED